MRDFGLTWVLVGGRARRVSEFAALPSARRPAVTCPACGMRLILKLGRVRRHHASHAPGAICAATRPETALHLDTKLALAARLAAAAAANTPLVLRLRCAGGALACDASRDVPWLERWDDVSVEAPLAREEARRRPDILLRRAGRAVAAIEVLVSHSVSAQKAADLFRLDIPWMEVRAGDAPLAADESNALVLHADRIGPAEAPDGWRCDQHARRARLLRAARVVDTYRVAGVRERRIYRVDELRIERVAQALVLRRDGRDVVAAPCDGSRSSLRAAWVRIREAFDDDLAELAADGAFHDSPMRWATGEGAENIVEEGPFDMRPGDPFPLATRFPRRWFFARDDGQWFLPQDMRTVRWDRTTPDAFGPHPAFARARRAVRERPAPAESWKGAVFARRPVAGWFAPPSCISQQGPIAIVKLEPVTPKGVPHTLVVLTSRATEAEVRQVAASLDAVGAEALWLSHPADWCAGRGDLPWAASAGDSRGRPIVLVDGLGVYGAESFARVLTNGEGQLSPREIRRRMAERVRAMREC